MMKKIDISEERNKVARLQKSISSLTNNIDFELFADNTNFNVYFNRTDFYLESKKVLDLDDDSFYNILNYIEYICSYFFEKIKQVEKKRNDFILQDFDIKKIKKSNKTNQSYKEMSLINNLDFAEKILLNFLNRDFKRRQLALKWLQDLENKMNICINGDRYINDIVIIKDNIFHVQIDININSIPVKETSNYMFWYAVEIIMKWLPSIKNR